MGKQRITNEEVEHVSSLAHIELTGEEKTLFTEQFNDILEFFKKIDEADTKNVSPTYHVSDLADIYRQDEAKKSLSTEETFRNAPKKEDGFFKSPRIV